MKVEIRRADRTGPLTLKLVAETPADRVVLADFLRPVGPATSEAAAVLYVDRYAQNVADEDLGPSGVSVSLSPPEG